MAIARISSAWFALSIVALGGCGNAHTHSPAAGGGGQAGNAGNAPAGGASGNGGSITAATGGDAGAVGGAGQGGAGGSGPSVLAATPPMGWNSWNRFGCNVSEDLIKATADAMVSSGMRDAGY